MSPTPPPPAAALEVKFRRAGFLLLGVIVLLVFHPALQGELLRWDDDVNISGNPHIKGLGWESIKWSLTDTKYYWRFQPLAWLTWNAIYQFSGAKPFLYHFVVVLLHAASAGLIFLLIEKLLRLARSGADAGFSLASASGAWLAAALWALHPMRVEAVAWAVELVYVMPLFFLLLSLLAYLKSAEVAAGAARYYWLSVACFAASLFTFPIALGGLVVFIALDMMPLRQLSLNPQEWFNGMARRVWWQKIPFIALTLLAAGLNFYARAYHVGQFKELPPLENFGLVERAAQAFYVWTYYLWKPLLPFHLTPVPMQLYDINPQSAVFVGSAIFIFGMTVGLFLMRRRWPAGLLLWICHLGLLVPMLGLSEHPHFPSDRYGLVVNIGMAIVLAAVFAHMMIAYRRMALTVAVVGSLIVVLSVMSYRQTLRWQNNERFLNYVLGTLPAEPKADGYRSAIHLKLAGYYLERGDSQRSVAEARLAIAVNPHRAAAHRALGDALIQVGDLPAAKASLEEAVRLDASQITAFNNLGVAYAMKSKLEQAVEQFQAVLQVQPDNANALQNLARARAMLAAGTNSPSPPQP